MLYDIVYQFLAGSRSHKIPLGEVDNCLRFFTVTILKRNRILPNSRCLEITSSAVASSRADPYGVLSNSALEATVEAIEVSTERNQTGSRRTDNAVDAIFSIPGIALISDQEALPRLRHVTDLVGRNEETIRGLLRNRLGQLSGRLGFEVLRSLDELSAGTLILENCDVHWGSDWDFVPASRRRWSSSGATEIMRFTITEDSLSLSKGAP